MITSPEKGKYVILPRSRIKSMKFDRLSPPWLPRFPLLEIHGIWAIFIDADHMDTSYKAVHDSF